MDMYNNSIESYFTIYMAIHRPILSRRPLRWVAKTETFRSLVRGRKDVHVEKSSYDLVKETTIYVGDVLVVKETRYPLSPLTFDELFLFYVGLSVLVPALLLYALAELGLLFLFSVLFWIWFLYMIMMMFVLFSAYAMGHTGLLEKLYFLHCTFLSYFLFSLIIRGNKNVVSRILGEIRKYVRKEYFFPPRAIANLAWRRHDVVLEKEWEKWREIMKKMEKEKYGERTNRNIEVQHKEQSNTTR